jgi:hypothetical protein
MQIKNRLYRASYWIVPGLLFARFISAGVTYAQGNVPAIVTDYNNLPTALWCPIIDTFFWALISISVVMALYAAYNYITAGDDTEKKTKARKILTYAAVGIVVALIAAGFPALVASLFPNSGASGYEVCS